MLYFSSYTVLKNEILYISNSYFLPLFILSFGCSIIFSMIFWWKDHANIRPSYVVSESRRMAKIITIKKDREKKRKRKVRSKSAFGLVCLAIRQALSFFPFSLSLGYKLCKGVGVAEPARTHFSFSFLAKDVYFGGNRRVRCGENHAAPESVGEKESEGAYTWWRDELFITWGWLNWIFWRVEIGVVKYFWKFNSGLKWAVMKSLGYCINAFGRCFQYSFQFYFSSKRGFLFRLSGQFLGSYVLSFFCSRHTVKSH